MLQQNQYLRSTLVIISTLMLIGCSGTSLGTSGLVKRLSQRGIVSVSPDNPFLAGNLLLTREAEQHPELQGFLELAGLPSALKTEDSMFSNNTLTLYYTDQHKFYQLERTTEGWLIDGPSPLSNEQQAELTNLTEFNFASNATPKLEKTANNTRAALRLPAIETESTFSPPPILQPVAMTATVDPFNSTINRAPGLTANTRQPFQSVIRKPEIISQDPANTISDEGQAEITPRGDIVHYVTYPGETLTTISKWYTGEDRNTNSLARINGLLNKSKLELGDTIVIPSYLIKNSNRLPEKALQPQL